jgi:pantetheine-phosphate adenylyltransferase
MTGIETLFMPTSPQWSYLSSTLIKEVARHGGEIGGLVPPFVAERLSQKVGRPD